jgi:hypothetical protein
MVRNRSHRKRHEHKVVNDGFPNRTRNQRRWRLQIQTPTVAEYIYVQELKLVPECRGRDWPGLVCCAVGAGSKMTCSQGVPN